MPSSEVLEVAEKQRAAIQRAGEDAERYFVPGPPEDYVFPEPVRFRTIPETETAWFGLPVSLRAWWGSLTEGQRLYYAVLGWGQGNMGQSTLNVGEALWRPYQWIAEAWESFMHEQDILDAQAADAAHAENQDRWEDAQRAREEYDATDPRDR